MKRIVMTGSLLLLAVMAGRTALSQEAASSSIVEPTNFELSSLTGSGVWQLRIYTINRGRLDDFVDAWREGVYPLRLEHGFQIPAAWLIRDNNQFVWILGYDGSQEDWEAKQSEYYGSSQRQSLGVDPLDWIAHGESSYITPVTSER